MKVLDLVCGRELDEKEAIWIASFGEDTFFFCSEECRNEFRGHPEEYLEREPALAGAASASR